MNIRRPATLFSFNDPILLPTFLLKYFPKYVCMPLTYFQLSSQKGLLFLLQLLCRGQQLFLSLVQVNLNKKSAANTPWLTSSSAANSAFSFSSSCWVVVNSRSLVLSKSTLTGWSCAEYELGLTFLHKLRSCKFYKTKFLCSVRMTVRNVELLFHFGKSKVLMSVCPTVKL